MTDRMIVLVLLILGSFSAAGLIALAYQANGDPTLLIMSTLCFATGLYSIRLLKALDIEESRK